MSFLTRDAISVERLVAETAAPNCGGTCVYLGTVRNGADERGVTGIEYSGYEEMVDAELARIIAEVHDQWPTARAAVRHRLGLVPVGSASSVGAVSAPHHATAYAGCRSVVQP